MTMNAHTIGTAIAVGVILSAHPAGLEAQDLRQLLVENHLEYLPSGDGPFSTIIAVPGCSGIAFADPEEEERHPELKEDDRLFRRHYREMAERFRAEGFAVLLIDVHRAEGVVTACAGEIGADRIAEYIDEAVAWANRLEFVDSKQVHVLGWSMGGWGALAWLRGTRSQSRVVKSVVLVYPACSGREPLTNPVSLLVLLGGADDIADPAVCENLVAVSETRGSVIVRRYPGARHGFDIEGAPSALDIGGGMTVGYQRAAADAAWREIVQFLTSRR